MSSHNEQLKQLRHDVNGACTQLMAALPLVESLLESDPKEAHDILTEMAESARCLSKKIQDQIPPQKI